MECGQGDVAISVVGYVVRIVSTTYRGVAGAKSRVLWIYLTGCGASDIETVAYTDMEPLSGTSWIASWKAVVGERSAVG